MGKLLKWVLVVLVVVGSFYGQAQGADEEVSEDLKKVVLERIEHFTDIGFNLYSLKPSEINELDLIFKFNLVSPLKQAKYINDIISVLKAEVVGVSKAQEEGSGLYAKGIHYFGLLIKIVSDHASRGNINYVADLNQFIRKELKIDNEGAKDFIELKLEETEQRLRIEKDIVDKARKAREQDRFGSEKGQRTPTREDIAEFNKQLDEKIPVQVEIREKFKAEYERLHIYGYAAGESTAMFLMGPSKVGKTTAIKEAVDAEYGYKGAWKDHVEFLPVIRRDSDLTKYRGSSPQFIGSDKLQPFLRKLVKHSAGKYIMPMGYDAEIDDSMHMEKRKSIWRENLADDGLSDEEIDLKLKNEKPPRFKSKDISIELNPNWRPGQVLKGYYARLTIAVPGIHLWSEAMIDTFLLPALKDGEFIINSTGDSGVDRMEIPVRFVFMSSHGIHKVHSVNKDGTRFGEVPLSEERQAASYERIRNNKDELRQIILAANSDTSVLGEAKPGISDDFLKLIPNDSLIFAKPITKKDLEKYYEIQLQELAQKVRMIVNGPRSMTLFWSPELVQFLVNYSYQSEEMASQVDAKVKNLIHKTIDQIILSGGLSEKDSKGSFLLDVEKNPNKTTNLVIYKIENGSATPGATSLIQATQSELEKERMSESRLEEFKRIGGELKKAVIGQDHLIDRYVPKISAWLEGVYSKADENNPRQSALVVMKLGLSSTGKTELNKAEARILLPEGERAALTVNFNSLQTVDAFEKYFYGVRKTEGFESSVFMKHFDMYNGRIKVNLEEFSNAPRAIKMMFYDFFRERVISQFADNKPRYMGNVFFSISGNDLEQWFRDIPKDIPVDQYMVAMQEIYARSFNDYALIRESLSESMSDATVNRVGEENILVFAPLDFKAIRRLTFLKIDQYLKTMKETEGSWGWDIKFMSIADYDRFVEIVEREGFDVFEQGASIDRFVKTTLMDRMKHLLFENKIASGSRIGIRVPSYADILERKRTFSSKGQNKEFYFDIEVVVEGANKTLPLSIRSKPVMKDASENMADSKSTTYHEVAHEYLRKRGLGDIYESELITTLPGVARMANRWVHFLGVAQYNMAQRKSITRDRVIREIGLAMAGFQIERFITTNERDSAGKAQDIAEATKYATRAVMEWGLSDEWGPRSVQAEEYNHLPEKDKEVIGREVKKLLTEGWAFAAMIIEQDFDKLDKLARLFAKRRVLFRSELQQFYDTYDVKVLESYTRADLEHYIQKVSEPVHNKAEIYSNEILFKPGVADFTMPAVVEIIEQRRQKALDEVQRPSSVPVWIQSNTPARLKGVESYKAVQVREAVAACEKYFN